MKKLLNINNRLFLINISLILIISFIFRFTNYENRWGLAYDQAYDTIVARYALLNHKIPFLGRFSSAGPFQTGGEWFWLIMTGIALKPDSIIAPWIILTLIYVLFVFLIILFSKELVDREFALITGILTSLSTAQIAQGTNLTNQSPQAIISLLSLWFIIRYIRINKVQYIFLSSFCIGLASSIHLQGTALVILVILTLFVSKNLNLKTMVFTLVGLIIPWIPVFIIDFQNHFFNIRNMFQYYLHDQFKISLDVIGRRWLTYVGVFWPNSWALIIGGYSLVIYFMAPFSILYLIYKSKNKTISKEWLVIIGSYFLIFCLLRYIRTPLYDSYLVFIHPFVLIMTAGIVYKIKRQNNLLGYCCLLILIIGSLLRSHNEVYSATNKTYKKVYDLEVNLDKNFGHNKYAVFDLKYSSSSISLPLVLLLYTNNKISDYGTKIGVVNCQEITKKTFLVVTHDADGTCIVYLNKFTNLQLNKLDWVLTNPSTVYTATQDWYKNENK